MLTVPIVKIPQAISSLIQKLELPISKIQSKNLAMLFTAILTTQSLHLTKTSLVWLKKRSINAFSHFLSYAPMTVGLFMPAMVRMTIKQFNLANLAGRFIIDDTMEHHSKFCKLIHGVYWLFDHAIGANVHARCIVVLYFAVNESIRFPVGWRIFHKEGTKKYDLALELIDDALSWGLKCSVVLFDSWFCVAPFLNALDKRGLAFIGEVKKNQNALVGIEQTDGVKQVKLSISKLFEYLHFKCRKVTFCLKGKKSSSDRPRYEVQSIVTPLAAYDKRVLFVHSTDLKKKSTKVLITNVLSWEAKKVIEEYSYRWLIEEFFKNAKGFYGLEGASVRSEQGGALALFLVSLADLLVSIDLDQGVRESSDGELLTVSSIVAKIKQEILSDFIGSLADADDACDLLAQWQAMLNH